MSAFVLFQKAGLIRLPPRLRRLELTAVSPAYYVVGVPLYCLGATRGLIVNRDDPWGVVSARP